MDDVVDGKRRRSRRKTASGYTGYSLSDSTVSYGAVSADEVEDGIDPETMNAMVVDKARIVGETRLALEDDHETEAEFRKPTVDRCNSFEKELRLRLVHKMLLRDIPMNKIAETLGVGINQVTKYRQEIANRLKEAASNLDVNELVGDGLGFYKEVQAMSLRTASQADVPLNMQLAALRTSLAAKNDMHRFLQAAGVFDVLRYKPKDGAANKDIQRLVEATRSMLFGQETTEEDNEGEDHEEISLL
jgi:transposase-like protein